MTALPDPVPLPQEASYIQGSASILAYLQHRLQGYPFDQMVDPAFVEELLDDFPKLDILEQIKLWRWYYNGHPPLQRQPRAALRRWLARAQR
jgi:hypothetical protein